MFVFRNLYISSAGLTKIFSAESFFSELYNLQKVYDIMPFMDVPRHMAYDTLACFLKFQYSGTPRPEFKIRKSLMITHNTDISVIEEQYT